MIEVDDFPKIDLDQLRELAGQGAPQAGAAATADEPTAATADGAAATADGWSTQPPLTVGQGWTLEAVEGLQEYWSALYDVVGNIGVPFVLPPLGEHWALQQEKAHRLALATAKLIPYTKLVDTLTERAPIAVLIATIITDAAPKWKRTKSEWQLAKEAADGRARAASTRGPAPGSRTFDIGGSGSGDPGAGSAGDRGRAAAAGPEAAAGPGSDTAAAGVWPGPSIELLQALSGR